jgi:uncharacterized RDD family membrane protein YckC
MVMASHRALARILEVAFLGGLAVAYLASAAGLIGWLNARDVALCALSGGAFSFVMAVGYFIVSGRELKRRSTQG